MSGASYKEISKRVGVSSPTAYQYVKKALADLRDKNTETAIQLRALEVMRMDKMMEALWNRAVEGDEKAIDTILKIQARKARLLGLDAPEKVDTTMSVTNEDRAKLVDQLTAEVVANAASTSSPHRRGRKS